MILKHFGHGDSIRRLMVDDALLQQAWKRVRATGGGPGEDGQTLEQFERESAVALRAMQDRLARAAYQFSRLRSAVIPKENGGQRKLGIPEPAARRWCEGRWSYRAVGGGRAGASPRAVRFLPCSPTSR